MSGSDIDDETSMRDDTGSTDCNACSLPRAAGEIQDWLVTYIARELDVPTEQIDVAVPFEAFALDSATAVGMTGDLEAWLGCRIDPTIVYDYPTIQDIAQYLAAK